MSFRTLFSSLKRGFPFAIAGMLTLTLWAVVFAALSSLAAYGAACYFSPNRHNSPPSIVVTGVATMIPIALPLTFVLSLGVSLAGTKATNALPKLLILCALRSLMGTVLCALIGTAIAAAFGVPQASGSIAPPYFYGSIAGWMLGFFVGLLWGSVECAVRSKKAVVILPKPQTIPPIAAP